MATGLLARRTENLAATPDQEDSQDASRGARVIGVTFQTAFGHA